MKIMNKKILLITLVILALGIAACERDDTQDPGGDTGFVGGTKGVDISFATNAPPERVADQGNDEFFVQVDLSNEGEHEILKENVFVQLEGFSTSAFGIPDSELTNNKWILHPEDDLLAVRKSPDGSVISSPTIPVIFEGLSYQGDAPANLPFTIRAKACYQYQTTALSDICVKENFNDDRPGDICQVSSVRKVSNSGAPVQITNVKQSPYGRDRTMVTFSLQQRDTNPTGKVSRLESECSTEQSNENRVFVNVAGLEESTEDIVSCIGLSGGTSGFVTLNKDEARDISCTVTLQNKNSRVQPFRVTVNYDYSAHIDKNIVVVYTPE
ncbi:MAG: hypothetical protein ACLFN8_03725 [Candidatus Woesearchaeota archaeon]